MPFGDAQELLRFLVGIDAACALAGRECEGVRLDRIIGAIEVHRDLGDRIGHALAQRLCDAFVGALQPPRVERLAERFDEQRVHEHVAIAATTVCRLDHTRAHPAFDRNVQRLGCDARRVLQHAKVELATDHRCNGQHVAIGGAELCEAASHQIEDAIRQAQFGDGMPMPAILVPPDVAFVDQRAERLDHEQWIPFGLPIEIGEEFPLDLLPMERRVHPAAQLFAREPRECLLVYAPIVYQLAHALVHVGCHVLHAERETEQHRFLVELRDDVFERIPAGGVRALQIVEHDHERTTQCRVGDVVREFDEQCELAPRRHRRRGRRGEAGHDARQFRPARAVERHGTVLRRRGRNAHAEGRRAAIGKERGE